MKKEQRKRIVDRHRDSLTRYGHHPNALYWSSQRIQEIRFQVLADIGVAAGDSVLDVGCGFADFKTWLQTKAMAVDFTGVDLSPDLIRVAGDKHPDATLLCGELFDFHFKATSFDWVILSGAMNEALYDDGVYARKMIAAMFALCGKGLAFNMLDARTLKVHDLQSVDPQEMLIYCRTLCDHVTLQDDYLANDFTIYMRR